MCSRWVDAGRYRCVPCGCEQRGSGEAAENRPRFGAADSLLDSWRARWRCRLWWPKLRGVTVCALGETSGLQRDGARCNTVALEPGVQICLGTTTPVAESSHWICLRALCARLPGWGAERLPVVEQALQAIRRSITHQAPLRLHVRCEAEGRRGLVWEPWH
jgi:hypothetical protein